VVARLDGRADAVLDREHAAVPQRLDALARHVAADLVALGEVGLLRQAAALGVLAADDPGQDLAHHLLVQLAPAGGGHVTGHPITSAPWDQLRPSEICSAYTAYSSDSVRHLPSRASEMHSRQVTVLVGESQPLFLDALARVVRQDPESALVAEVSDGRDAPLPHDDQDPPGQRLREARRLRPRRRGRRRHAARAARIAQGRSKCTTPSSVRSWGSSPSSRSRAAAWIAWMLSSVSSSRS